MRKGYFRMGGFTLLELLVVIGIIGILAAVVLVAVNPSRQFASARDTQRRSDLYSLTNAIYQYAAENDGSIPTDITTTMDHVGLTGVDLSDELVPTYLPAIPQDPTTGDANNTGYSIYLDANGRIVASASSEVSPGTVLQVLR